MYKIDLHTHSTSSPDGNLKTADYRRMLKDGRLDYVAVTDHDGIFFALELKAELGDRIIIGEEISTTDGDLIGLYLRSPIQPGQTATATADAIHRQGGLVYVPHPFERLRKGLQLEIMDAMTSKIDIVEVHNGRYWSLKAGQKAQTWAKQHHKATASSSDAHGRRGWGRTHSIISDKPSQKNLVKLLKSADLSTRSVGVVGRTYPKLSKLKKKLR